MTSDYDILAEIPHERIQSQHIKDNERFDLFKLGVFNVKTSILSQVFNCSVDRGYIAEIVELVKLQPNSNYTPHYHKNSAAVIYMVLGEGVLLLDKTEMPYKPGVRIEIPSGMSHGFITNTETLFLSIQAPPIKNNGTGEVDLHYVKD